MKVRTILIAAICGVFGVGGAYAAAHGLAYASVGGAGSVTSPLEGIAEVGDVLTGDTYVRNLSVDNDTRIRLRPIYIANTYDILFQTGKGSFSDDSDHRLITETYGEPAVLPEEPVHPEAVFAGWYLKGNREPEDHGDKNARLLTEETIFLLAADDAEDMADSMTDAEGLPVAKALWRNNTPRELPGFEPDKTDPDTNKDADLHRDLWDPQNNHNHVIEWLSALPEKKDYRQAHGPLRYRYGHLLLDAETEEASNYRWYALRPGSGDYELLPEEGAVLTLSRLTREDDGTRYRCLVSIGGEGDMLLYETMISVSWLPAAAGVQITDNGEKISYARTG